MYDRDNIYDRNKPSVVMKFKCDVTLEYQDEIIPQSIVAKSAYLVIFVRGESQTCPLAVIGIKKVDNCIGLISAAPNDKELLIEYAMY